jgi:nucleoside-triphosphatase THEP1
MLLRVFIVSKINLAVEFISDACKIADSKDIFKEFLNNNDEFLSSNSWGSLLKYLSKKAVQIDDLNEAYYFTLYTSYLNAFILALDYHGLKENNFSLPNKNKHEYNYQEFELNKILSNNLKTYFDGIFQDFVQERDKAKIQRYINNNIKYNYFKVLQEQNFVLEIYIKHINSALGLEEQNSFKKELYRQKIQKEYFDIVMADINGLSLNELYIEQNFRIHKSCFSYDDERVKEKNIYDSKYIEVKEQSIHKFVENILLDKNEFSLNKKNVNTVFIAGQPGQGKSSFTKRFCNDVLNNHTSLEKDIILIKLKEIERPKELIDTNIRDIIKNEISKYFDENNFENYIVIFDGLDELAMKTGLSTSDIDIISQNISRTPIDTIITTRHGYVNFDTLNEENILIIELKELSKKQQLSWIKNYKNYSDVKFDENTIKNLYKMKMKINIYLN